MQHQPYKLRVPYIAAGISLAAMLFFLQGAVAQSKSTPKDIMEMTVVLDPGHGGSDLGARGLFSCEKDVVLSIAKKIGEKTVQAYPDIEIVYTRAIDTFITLDDRGTIANRVNADLFISIHANSLPTNTSAARKRATYGTETYVMGLEKNDKNMDVATSENAVILFEDNYEAKYEGYDPNSPESFIMFAFMQNAHIEQSLDFAARVEQQLARHADRHSRGVKQGPFLVLWRTAMPSVLIETGFISNSDEEKYLNSEEGQTKIAEAICIALGSYKEQWEKKRIAALQAASENRSKPNEEIPSTINPAPPQKAAASSASANAAPANPTSSAKPKPASDRVTYHVQIFSTSKLLKPNAREFKGLKNVSYYRYKNAYRYYVGEDSSRKEITPLLKEVQKKFPDAFIIPLKNGKSFY